MTSLENSTKNTENYNRLSEVLGMSLFMVLLFYGIPSLDDYSRQRDFQDYLKEKLPEIILKKVTDANFRAVHHLIECYDPDRGGCDKQIKNITPDGFILQKFHGETMLSYLREHPVHGFSEEVQKAVMDDFKECKVSYNKILGYEIGDPLPECVPINIDES